MLFDDAGFLPPLCDLGGAPSPTSVSNGSFKGSEDEGMHTPTSLRLSGLPFQGAGGFDRAGGSCINGGGGGSGGGGCCGGDCPCEDALRSIVKEITRGNGGVGDGDCMRSDNFGVISAVATAATAIVATASTVPGFIPAYSPVGASASLLPPRGVLEKQRRQKPATKTGGKAPKKRLAAGSKKQQGLLPKKTKAKERQQVGHVRKSGSDAKAAGAAAEEGRPRKISRTTAGGSSDCDGDDKRCATTRSSSWGGDRESKSLDFSWW